MTEKGRRGKVSGSLVVVGEDLRGEGRGERGGGGSGIYGERGEGSVVVVGVGYTGRGVRGAWWWWEWDLRREGRGERGCGGSGIYGERGSGSVVVVGEDLRGEGRGERGGGGSGIYGERGEGSVGVVGGDLRGQEAALVKRRIIFSLLISMPCSGINRRLTRYAVSNA